MWQRIQRFLQSEEGPTTVEYAIMLALIIMVCVSSIIFIGDTTNNMFGMVSNDAFNNQNQGIAGP